MCRSLPRNSRYVYAREREREREREEREREKREREREREDLVVSNPEFQSRDLTCGITIFRRVGRSHMILRSPDKSAMLKSDPHHRTPLINPIKEACSPAPFKERSNLLASNLWLVWSLHNRVRRSAAVQDVYAPEWSVASRPSFTPPPLYHSVVGPSLISQYLSYSGQIPLWRYI